MPLHTIPLCSFDYVGDTLSSATFRYDARECLSKNRTKLCYAENKLEIDKNDNKSCYSSNIKINKNSSKDVVINDDNEIGKNIKIRLDKTNKSINKSTEKELSSIEKFIIKENLLELSSNKIEIDMLKGKNLLNMNNIELSKEWKRQLNRDLDYKLDNSNKGVDLDNVSTIKDINIKSNIKLDRVFEQGIDINSNVNVAITRQQILDKTVSTHLDRDKEKRLDVALNNKYVDINITRDIDTKDNILNVNRVAIKEADILTSIYLDRENKKKFLKTINSSLAYKINNFKLDKYSYIDVERDNVRDIIKPIDTKLFYINTLKRISKFNNTLGLNKDTIYRASKYSTVELDKDILNNINKYNVMELDKDKISKIFKSKSNSIESIRSNNIYKEDLLGLNKDEIRIYNEIDIKGLNKSDTNIYIPYELNGLNKLRIDIYNPYATTDLEVIKRWWVLGATSPYDQKIVPYDYNYSNNPLLVNNRIAPYGNLTPQDRHPISFMPYLEENKGIDLSYGVEEINLSIEIMIDMVNIVGMIVQHGASQFANCSGQEAIEFIMEVLLDWLNLDSTIQEMNSKGSREHYLRCYKWIRWEAEKVWFVADKDHTQDRMMGIKYAGMLFANLIDYMKFHHFDIVPLWRNLKYMDIERQFNRIATNGDIITDLDKLKGRRHYFIETQNK
ncbi:hypothetical protein [Clostridium sp. JNZ J1-5]